MSDDEERLPPGFVRTGYDADSQRYTFSSPDGTTYESEPGNRYGQLWPVGQRPQRTNVDVEAQNKSAVRMMLPFALLVFVFMILLFKLINRSSEDGANHGGKQVVYCAEGTNQIQIHKGDTCWDIAEKYHLNVDRLLRIKGNERVDCDALHVGQGLCVPSQD